MATRKSVEEGKTIAEPLAETEVFPPMVVQMIGVGEQTGALDAMLTKIADFYEDEVDTAVAGLMKLIEPVMIVFLGVDHRRHRHRDVPADVHAHQQDRITAGLERLGRLESLERRRANRTGAGFLARLPISFSGAQRRNSCTSPGVSPVNETVR